MKHKISVPIMSSTVNDNNRQKYVQLCREMGAERVFLVNDSIMEDVPQTLAKNVAYFKSCGYEVGVWTDTIGHGFVLSHVKNGDNTARFSSMVDIKGQVRQHAYCPLDENFTDYVAKRIAVLADTGADIVMLDDDFRMSQHGGELCCACPKHLRRISEILGEEVSLDKLRETVVLGKPNKYRDAWLTVQNEGLVKMAKAIRFEVDKNNPHVIVCICTAYAPWNVDGTDVIEITKILAGKNKPLIRLTGAPYWAVKRFKYPLIATFEIARMLASFVSNEGFEIMSEGDVYPRPRYTCPASYLELYDAVTRIDGGYDGILKYVFDYVAGPDFETGYLKFHKENAKFHQKISEFFGSGANAGVRIYAYPHTIKYADYDLTTPTEVSPRPLDGTMFGSCGIPTIYNGKGVCNSIFGDNARLFEVDLLNEGSILDATSAVILTERGVDVGLSSYGELTSKQISFLCTDDSKYKSFITDGAVRFLTAKLSDGAIPLMYSSEKDELCTVAYKYENANGQRFLVFLFEGDSIYHFPTRVCLSGIIKNYVIQRVLLNTLPWVARKNLPVYCEGNPELYVMCKKEDKSMSIALFNCFADSLTNPALVLDDNYNKLECVNCDAVLDGNRIIIKSKIHAFDFAFLRVSKE